MADFDNTPAEPVAFVHEPWAEVRAALTAGGTDPTTIKDGDTLDGVELETGDRFVCVGARADAGIYTVGALSSARSSDANSAVEFAFGRTVRVAEGSSDNRGTWRFMTEGAVNLGVTVLTISKVSAIAASLAAATAFDNNPPGTLTV